MDEKNKVNTRPDSLAIEDLFRSARISVAPGLPFPGRVYESLFWRPFLGGLGYSLWEVLRDFQPEAKAKEDGRWPTISVISKALGIGDRFTILGRDATSSRPEQSGELDHLRQEGLVIYFTLGEGKGKRYWFAVAERLPILTPTQAAQLPSVLQRRHRKWIDGLGLLDVWEALVRPTLIQPGG